MSSDGSDRVLKAFSAKKVTVHSFVQEKQMHKVPFLLGSVATVIISKQLL